MRTRRDSALLFFMMALSIESTAGEHYVEKDDFSGKVYHAYRMTAAERSKAGFDMWLNDYDAAKQTIEVTVVAPLGVDCESQGLEVKTHDGTIHKVNALESRMESCFASLPLEWIKKSFTVRVQMRVRNPLVGRMDTNSIKPERYAVK